MKLKFELLTGELKQIKPNIFAVVIEDDYDRSMLFCRYQEFYESPIKSIRGKYFTFEKFMREYKNFRGEKTFTYPTDWAGFNIPSNIMYEARDTFGMSNVTDYDIIMRMIIYTCEMECESTKWYLIGADSFTSKTMNHEIAHGLYYTNLEYKRTCNRLIKNIKPTHYEKLRKGLIKMGYRDTKKIIDDEIQAFMSTGLYNGLDTKELKKYEKDFIQNFKTHNK